MFIPVKIKKLKIAPVLPLICLLGPATLLTVTTVPLEVDQDRSRLAAHVEATGHSFDAVVTDYELDLRIDTATGGIVSATLTFDFADVKTGRDRRDREMREWLDYGTHPRAEFVLDVVEELDEASDEVRVRGALTMHGVENEIEFLVRIQQLEDEIRITGHTVIDHRDWELERIRAFLIMTVDTELRIEFDLFASAPEE